MPKETKVSEVLKYLQTEGKSRREIEAHFTLSNTESWHLVSWLQKWHLVETHKVIKGGARCDVHKATSAALKEYEI